jgi:hypothetical protein
VRIAVVADGPDVDETIGVAERLGAKEGGIHQAKDGGVGTDAEREGENGDGGEGGGFAEGAGAEAEILEEGFEESDAAGVATFFFGAFEASEFELGAAERFVARDAGAD